MIIIPYLLAIFKNIVYGASVFFTSSLTASCDVLDVLALRFLLSFVVMWGLKITGILKIKVGIKEVFVRGNRSSAIRSLILTAIFEPVLYMLFETLGISMTTNVTAAIVISLSPVMGCIFEVVVLRERCSLLEKILLGVGIVGVVYVALMTGSSGGENSPVGILCLFLAVASGASFSVFSRKSSKSFSAMEITYFTCLLGAFAFNAVNLVRHALLGTLLTYFDPYFNLENIIGFIFLGVISTIVATGMNNICLSKLQVSTVSAFCGLSTVVTILIGVFVGGENLYYYHYIGMSLIAIRMIGISWISISRTKKNEKLALKTEAEKEMSKSGTK
jgi:drug/metabolite transporter (DMT)-like permease